MFRRRLAVTCVLLVLVAGCSSAPKKTFSVEDYNAAVAVGPFAAYDQESLDYLGRSACVEIRKGGKDSFAADIQTLQRNGMTEAQATRAVSAFVVRFCPEVATG